MVVEVIQRLYGRIFVQVLAGYREFYPIAENHMSDHFIIV